MPRTSAFNDIGSMWWKWVQKNHPKKDKASLSTVSALLGVSAQTIHAMVNGKKQCTIDRMVNYTNDLEDYGWPCARIVIDNGKVWIENRVNRDTLSKDSAAAMAEASSLGNTDGDCNYSS
jgi:hypothetical protein